MSARAGVWNDDEIEDLVEGEHEGGDTELVKNLRAALKAQTKARKEAETERDGFKTTTRKSSLADLLKARELDPKVAAFIPAEVEATEEGVGKWLDEYGDVFGAKPPAQQQSALTDEQIAAMRQMDSLAGATSPAVTNDMLRSVQNAETPEALIALIHAAGGTG